MLFPTIQLKEPSKEMEKKKKSRTGREKLKRKIKKKEAN